MTTQLTDTQISSMVSEFEHKLKKKITSAKPKTGVQFGRVVGPLVKSYSKEYGAHLAVVYGYTKNLRKKMMIKVLGGTIARKHLKGRSMGGTHSKKRVSKKRVSKKRVSKKGVVRTTRAKVGANQDTWKEGIDSISATLGINRSAVRDMAVAALREKIRNHMTGS